MFFFVPIHAYDTQVIPSFCILSFDLAYYIAYS